jgi:hypothetical protein
LTGILLFSLIAFLAAVFHASIMPTAAEGENLSPLRTFQTTHFNFTYHYPDQKSLQPLFEKAEEVREKIRIHLPPIPPRVVQVRIASSSREFLQLQPEPKGPIWALAIAYPQQGLILMKSPRMVTQGHPDILQTFQHELTHILLGDAFGPRPVPSWLQEGIAQLMEEAWDFHRISVMTRAVLADEVIPLWDLTASFPVDLYKAEIAYAESYYFISFLLNRYGRDALQNFILEMSKGVELDVALSRATGMRLRDIIRLWEQFIKVRFNWIPIITGGGTLWFAASLVLFAGYMLKRRRSRRILQQWELEEKMPDLLRPAESLEEGKEKIDKV